jgi:hypothetical protein
MSFQFKFDQRIEKVVETLGKCMFMSWLVMCIITRASLSQKMIETCGQVTLWISGAFMFAIFSLAVGLLVECLVKELITKLRNINVFVRQ